MLTSCSRPTTNNSPLAYPTPNESSSKTMYKTKIPKQSPPAAKKPKTN
jgi:hypothetical protein